MAEPGTTRARIRLVQSLATSAVSVSLPCRIGRGPHNTIVLDEDEVSWSHCELRTEGRCLVLEDFASHNGTRLDGKRVRGCRAVRPHQEVGIGDTVIHVDAYALGTDPSPAPPVHASVPPTDPGAYRVVVHRGPKPRVHILDDLRGGTVGLEAENRIYCLLVLAERWWADRTHGVAPERLGWVADNELALLVWGRHRIPKSRTRVNTLVHRVREDLEAAGMPPSIIQKHNRHTRLRAGTVELYDRPGRG